MLFRRIRDHLQAHNWAAVAIDFVIVVLGVLFALTAEQWIGSRQQQANLEQAETALNRDLLNTLFAARESKALAPCRKERVALLSRLLEQDDERWAGIPWNPNPGAFDTRLPELMPTPYRYWGSRVWLAEQQTGTLSGMAPTRRRTLDEIFNGANAILMKQEEVFQAQSHLKTLAMDRPISAEARVRYLEILHYYDQQAGLLERMAEGTLEQLETIRLMKDDFYVKEFSAYLPSYMADRSNRYGPCFTRFDMPFIQQIKTD